MKDALPGDKVQCDLFLCLGSDWKIRDENDNVIDIETARRRYMNGLVCDRNRAFDRLAYNDFRLEDTKREIEALG